ncbi:haloacid dehalogenase type II [Alienimonas californiensis]|uniref:(S)-2-haloacid dehalogenase n=1 Tax=Alienimonas californiensis TaxID=2527989 RepID=A0A517P4W2_9PLAN|nr:haloacid dehalogenase type II [Alienimonas californiensis]QDT14419.1 (S)-2-haloacid dehalogenase [Alienimonas californiensis]
MHADAPLDRRLFVAAAAAAAPAALAGSGPPATTAAPADPGPRPKVIFLDVNETLLNLDPLVASVGEALGGRPELVPLWFSSLLHHSLVATVGDRYEDFGVIGAATLRMLAANHGIDLSEKQAARALAPIRSLPPHPDVEPALKQLTEAGYQLVTLTNSSAAGVKAQMENSGLQRYLSARLSVETVGLFKPHAHVYRWAARQVGESVEDCLLVAAHGWDVAGAAWAGMRTCFLSRPGKQLYPLAPPPTLQAADLLEAARTLVALPR